MFLATFGFILDSLRFIFLKFTVINKLESENKSQKTQLEFNHLAWCWTENPCVSGSIPPLAPL